MRIIIASKSSLMRNRTLLAHIFGVVSLIALIFMTWTLAAHWRHLPQEIPTHFNWIGEIDATGGKFQLLVLLGITWTLFIGLTIVELIPNNDKVLSPAKQAAQFKILATTSSMMKAVLMIDLAYICDRTIAFKSLGRWFAPVFLLLIFVPIIIMTIKLVRISNEN